MKVLIIEDDKAIVRMLVAFLKRKGFETEVAFDGIDGCKLAKKSQFDVVILDIMLPDIKGWEVCEKIRAVGDVPILMLTAMTELKDKVRGLDLGADDYLTKPFELKELYARLEILMRRNPVLVIRGNELRAGSLYMNLKNHTVQNGDVDIELTRKEYSLLEYFLRNKNKILSRLKILTHVWDQNVDIFSNTVDVHVASLRKKIQINGQDYIKTIHGVGYMLKEGDKPTAKEKVSTS